MTARLARATIVCALIAGVSLSAHSQPAQSQQSSWPKSGFPPPLASRPVPQAWSAPDGL